MGRGARLFEGLGDFHRAATTQSPEAQKYFDQGMRYLWAFNHDEATRSFAKAAQLDPECAICYWGVSLTVGPNYNLPQLAAPRAAVAWEALQQAAARNRACLACRAGADRRAGEALHERRAARSGGGSAAADGIRRRDESGGPAISGRFRHTGHGRRGRDDQQCMEVVVAGRQCRAGTEEIVSVLELALSTHPMHPGANHYYIHAIEASRHPDRGIAAAQRLKGMMPAAGHLEHMPAHIYQRVGQYEAAAAANRSGIAADLVYFEQARPPNYYAMYTAHNYQFLAFSTAMQGRKAETLNSVQKSREVMPDEMLLAMPGADWYVGEQYAGPIRFGMWDEILTEPPPNPKLPGCVAPIFTPPQARLLQRARLIWPRHGSPNSKGLPRRPRRTSRPV
jgi:tetratricopeptide (TPR) repeat protein